MEHTATTNSTHTVKYLDCISGKVGVPKDKTQKALFQLMLIFFALPLTTTINWAISTSSFNWLAFSYHLSMIPLMFAFAIIVRFLIANPIIDNLVKAFVSPQYSCLKKSLIITTLNIVVMCTLASLIRGILVPTGGQGFIWEAYISRLPLTYLICFGMGYFITTPLMKKFFAHTVEPYFTTHQTVNLLPEPVSNQVASFKSSLEKLRAVSREKLRSALDFSTSLYTTISTAVSTAISTTIATAIATAISTATHTTINAPALSNRFAIT